jgi:fructose-bisphosphate aldolase class II
MVTGAVALAEFAHVVAERYPVNIALHTDHCPKDKLDTYVRPLLAISEQRIRDGGNPLFQSHMWDGSAVELTENLQIAADLLDLCARAKVVLEIEIGVVGGEEDGVVGEMNEKLYSTPRTRCARSRRSASARRGATCWPPRSATCTASTSRAT